MLDVRPMSPTIGAEVTGIDLRTPPDEGTFAELDKAFMEHKVLFFRDQDITNEQHIAFCRAFGELEIHPFLPAPEGCPEIVVLTHNEKHKGTENFWHSDVTWRLEPSLGSMLRAIEVPDVGGDTLFADMELAYENLGPALKEQLLSLTAVHDFATVFGHGKTQEQLAEMREKYPPAEHPVVRTHPVTGRRSLYVNVAFTSHIKGMRREESRMLLDYLYKQATFPEYQCRFRWAPNSLALWDNRCVQHYAVSDYWPATRIMQRVTIAGDKPV
jgi:taurine dioxygenase